MTRNSKRRNPNGARGNKSSPRRGAKSKQTKVTPAKETASKVVRQTKLTFSDQVMSPPSAAAAKSTAITPEIRPVTTRLLHPTPPETPERAHTTINKAPITSPKTSPSTPEKRINPPAKDPSDNHTNNDSENVKAPSEDPSDGDSDDDNGKKPKAVETLKNQQKTPPKHDASETPTETIKLTQNQNASPDDDESHNKIKKKKTKKAKSVKKKSDKTIPTALQTPSDTYKAIRYDGMIVLPPSEDPYQDFLKTLKVYFTIIQEVLGKDIFIASWDAEQETAFPPLKNPAKLPSSRESLGIYLGGYINPKQDGSRVYLNLRLITYKDHPVPMERFGMELADALANSKHKLSMRRQPKPCQAAKSECVGWMMYSCKSMNSETFIPALKKALKIPSNIAVGIQYRTIANENGKKPAFDKENPPAAAIHLDIDERYALVYQARAASLWRKNSKQRLPNGVQLRLVPCFTSATGKSMTDTQRSDAKTLLERQFYFIKEHLRLLPAYFFISQLDSPIGPDNDMTLRRAMMSRAPKNMPTGRLIHNVDASWNQPAKHTITSVIGRDIEAQRFLVNMIPEFLHQYGEGASKWFTGAALLVYKDIKWNPEKGTTSSSKERNSEEMVKEDLWDLNEQWEKIQVTETKSTRPATTDLDADGAKRTAINKETSPSIEQIRLASDKSVASFGNVYQRDHDQDDEIEAEAQAQIAKDQAKDRTGTQFEFSTNQLENDRLKAQNGPHSTGFSMSTAAKTTDSTRLKLKEAKEEINLLKEALAKQKLGDTPSFEQEYESPETTPETTVADSHTKKNHTKDSTKKTPIEAYTEGQALGAALSRKQRETIEVDSDAMEEEIVFTPINIGSSAEDSQSDQNMDVDEVINIGSSSSSSSSTDSSSESSESSSDSSSDDSTNSKNTQELFDSISKNTSKPEGNNGSPRDTADHQLPGSYSGSDMAHKPSLHPQGLAGDLPQAAGHGD
jgi:hypothetical protein